MIVIPLGGLSDFLSLRGLAKKGFKKLAEIAGKKSTEVASEATKKLHRPYTRKGTRTTVENRAPKTADGRYIDPNTGKPIDGSYDLGHKPGNEFRREKARAEAEGLSQKEFNDRMNNPDLYQIENPSSNRSHRYELPGND